MEHIDLQYASLVREILKAPKKQNRTGVDTMAIACRSIRHDMADGFPLLTTKKMGMKNIAAELECFIKGFSSKKEFHERSCHIRDEWCNPVRVPYANDTETKAKMLAEDDLGRIYGVQWRDSKKYVKDDETDLYRQESIDQLKNAVDILKNDPFGSPGRRIIVNAWNPAELNQMALPPCHAWFQFYVSEGKLSCQLYQRSADVFLGVPFNIASYALLTMMVAQVCDLKLGDFVHTFGDVHIYNNHVDQVNEQLSRTPKNLPRMKINPVVNNIFDLENASDFL
jgi:thymidylate synthase